MADNFFDLVNDKFFNPFTNANRRINFDLLRLINSKMRNQVIQFPRTDLIDWMMDYYENSPVELIDDESLEEEEDVDYQSVVSDKIRYFTECGWLIAENTNDFEVTYQMDSVAINILNAMEETVKNDDKPIEFTGYVYGIYSLLKTFTYDHATELVEQIMRLSNELNNNLRGLSTSIKKYLTNLLRKENIEAGKILNTILVEYQEKVILKAFNNLRVKDNPSRYKGAISDKIREFLKEENLQKMMANYILQKKDNVNTPENQKEAEDYFVSSLQSVLDQFDEIENTIIVLNERNTKYVATANARISYLLNQEKDIEGRIFQLLKLIEKTGDKIEEEQSFTVYDGGKADEFSLSAAHNNKRKIASEVHVEEMTVSEEELAKDRERLERELHFSSGFINQFIMDQLGDRKRMSASEIPVRDYDDIIRIFLAQIYGDGSNVDYSVVFTDRIFRRLNAELSDYEIVKRKKK